MLTRPSYLDTALNTGEVPLVKEKPTNLKLFGAPATQQQALKTQGNTKKISLEDIETFIREGDLAIEHDSMAIQKLGKIEQGIQKTTKYQLKLRSIQENASLIDSALANIRVCDPAIGSGAFPVGLMTEIVRARNTLNNYLPVKESRTNYNFKRHAIQNCLYGVDIDPGAVEIAKLRLWLSLVVDEEDIKQIQPLPNLDYKIVCGNSLMKCEQDIFYWPLFDELEKLKVAHFDETRKSEKDKYSQRINVLLDEIEKDGTGFNFTVDFSEIFPKQDTANRGFDIVIANPPYIRHEQIKELKSELKKYFDCYYGTADIYVYFYERGRQILKKNGTLAYISSNKYFRAGYGEKLRCFLGNNCQICQIIDFGDAPVFEAIAYPSIIILKNTPPEANEVKVFNWQPGPPLDEFASVVRAGSSPMPQEELTADGWRLESAVVLRLLAKLRKAGKPLGEYVNERFYRGIVTGLNEAFVIDRITRDRLIAEHPSSAEVLNPFLRGKDVKRWAVNFAEQYLLFVPWHFPLHNDESISGASERAEGEFRQKYPAVYRHLLKFKIQLEARNEDETGVRYEWYALQRCAATYWKEFERPKIVYPNICKRNEFAWDDQGYYFNQKAFIIPDASKYLLGILNSTVVTWLFNKLLAKLQNGFYEPNSIFMKDFPIPVTNKPEAIEALVNKIISAKAKDPDADVSDMERQIDQMVYKLYRLTPEEIAVVESKA